MMAIAAMTTQAQSVVDLTKWENTTLCLDDMVVHVDTIILQKESVKVQSVQYANILINDSVMMFGTTDGALFSIKDGKMIRPFCEPSFGVAQFSGEPAVHPGSALLDGHGKYCYAWGNAIVGGGRINFIKKMDFCTGEVVDSIDVNSADFSLSRDDSLRLAKISYMEKGNYTTMERNKFIARRNKLFCSKQYVQKPNYYIPDGTYSHLNIVEMWPGGPEPAAEDKLSVVDYDMIIPKKVNKYQPLELK